MYHIKNLPHAVYKQVLAIAQLLLLTTKNTMYSLRWGKYYSLGFIILALGIVGTNARPPLRIVNGESAVITEFPWLVSILLNSEHICGGAIIGARHILTAAHCVLQRTPADLMVSLGISHPSLKDKNLYGVAKIKIHPDYFDNTTEVDGIKHRDMGHDIAVISLVRKIEMNENKHSISLPSTDVPVSVVADLSGFGLVHDAPNGMCPITVQKIKVQISDPSLCEKHFKTVHSFEMCGITPTGSGPCTGDGGSALVYNHEVVGITSSGFCAKPALYTKVYQYKEFILEAIAKS